MADAMLSEIVRRLGSMLSLEPVAWGVKPSQLEKQLERTFMTINAVLQDADNSSQQLSQVILDMLQAVAYDAEDLFDEIATIEAQKMVKVFSRSIPSITFGSSITNRFKKIQEDLDEIANYSSNHPRSVEIVSEPRRRRNYETHSHVDASKVLGRDDDKKAILDLLDRFSDQYVCVVPIVGIGGIGKTTLAQLVFHEVRAHFDLRSWVYVSHNYDIKQVLVQILNSATNVKASSNHELDHLQKQLLSQLTGRKYLLVLDNVWDDDVEKWHELFNLLRVGAKGSKILVTTRSMKVAEIMGTIPDPYYLKGLSEEESWNLFRRIAFAPGQQDKDLELLSIGERVVKKCAGVPMAIKDLGMMLFGISKDEWLFRADRSFLRLHDEKLTMDVLRVSYDHLFFYLKKCFAYFALFPKGHSFKRETLIRLWMAQGFVIPAHEGQRLEDIGEEYFLKLSQMCFFQDVTRNRWGNVESCKVHPLMHDLALLISRECHLVTPLEEPNFGEMIRHLSSGYHSILWRKISVGVLSLKSLRTFLLLEQTYDRSIISESMLDQIFSRCRSLRVLDLHDHKVESLPSSISSQIHLRYINLSGTLIETLPNSIRELQNLQTLELQSCLKLKRLPTDIDKLVKLRSLDVSGCWSLIQMPSGIGLLTSLHNLPFIMVNSESSQDSRQKNSVVQLHDLRNLNSLKGSLEIEIKGQLKDPAYEAEAANLRSKHSLMELHIRMVGMLEELVDSGIHEHDEAILERLMPHPTLKKLQLSWYRGKKLPIWALNDNLRATLPYLVEIELRHCEACQKLPSFGKLPSLKYLSLEFLSSVEYIESSVSMSPSSPAQELFFPSLEELRLHGMPNLKGWWTDVEGAVRKSFPNLLKLNIYRCPRLTSIPRCPKVANMTLLYVNDTLSMLKMATSSDTSVASSSTSYGSSSKLKTLHIGDVEALVSLPRGCLSLLTTLKVQGMMLLQVSRLEELFESLSSLSCLEFSQCSNLRSIYGGLEHLTTLEKLVFSNCCMLDLSPRQGVDDSMPWRAMSSLQYLQLANLNKLVGLPNGLRYLTNLRCLSLERDHNLEALPEWISCLSSLEELRLHDCSKLACLPEGIRELTKLKELRIINCQGLTKRCRSTNGADWPKIERIQSVIVEDRDV